MTVKYRGELEIDSERGVIYFHLTNSEDVQRLNAVTLLRICCLPAPIPTDRGIDISHMHGVDWKSS